MTWIETVDPADAEGRLAELYRRWVDPATGAVDNILQVHSLGVRGLEAHLAVYRSAMAGTPGLGVLERELVAVVVSDANQCHY